MTQMDVPTRFLAGSEEDAAALSFRDLGVALAISFACIEIARILESGSDTFASAMLDTRPAILVTVFGFASIGFGSLLALAELRDLPLGARLRTFDARLAPALCSVGAVSILSLGTDSQSADSAVLISTTTFLNEGNWRWLLDSQEAPLPHVVYSPFVELGVGFDRLALVPVIGTVLLLYWVGAQILARTGSRLVAVFGVLATLAAPTIIRQSNRLTFYPWFALAGSAGIVGLCRFVLGRRSIGTLLASAVMIALAVASHGAGLYFAVLAFASLALVRERAEFVRWLWAMVAVGTANLPWLIAHFAVSGFTRFLTPRDSWILTKGYLLDINEFFWGLSVGSRLDALLNHPSVLSSALGALIVPITVLLVVGLRGMPRREAGYIVLAGIILVGSLASTRSAGFPRYFYPVIPGMVIVAALGLHRVMKRLPAPHWSYGLFGLAALVAIASTSLQPSMQSLLNDRERLAEVAQAARFIEADEGVIGYRSMALNVVRPKLRTLHHDLVDESEYLALYDWRQEELRQLSSERSVRWVLLTKPFDRWESSYNDAWFTREFGYETSHVRVLLRSDCLVYEGTFVALFDLPRCYSP